MNFFLYTFFGILPSFVWLLFYLKKDVHPESNRMVLKIFFYGMLAAVPVALVQIGASDILEGFNLPAVIFLFLEAFFIIALSEEGFKYWVVRWRVLKNAEFDEPIDVMLYMIIAALGFAASENILLLAGTRSIDGISGALGIAIWRFVSATFLHALASGALGYFLALAIFKAKGRDKTFLAGLGLVVILHGFYNLSIIEIDSFVGLVIPAVILLGLAIFVSWGFQKLKKLKSVCLLCFSQKKLK